MIDALIDHNIRSNIDKNEFGIWPRCALHKLTINIQNFYVILR